MDEQGSAITGNEPRSAGDRRLRELFLAYCGALVSPEGMASVFAPDFWPHDLIPGDHRPPEGVGTEAMMGFRAGINSAFTLRSGTGTWIEDDAELSELAAGAEPGAIVGAKTILTYVHDGGPVMLPGSDHGYEPTGREVVDRRTPRVARVSPMSRASGTDRASRSSLGTTRVSPERTAARAWSSPGRARLVPVRPLSR
jgi:hypothetical protein